jgi:LacI family transcriptional regulator
MYKPTTIKDIAHELHLSPSTVSRALRDGYEISIETKNAVVEYAKRVNYRSNPVALGLKNKRSYTIGMVVPSIDNSFFSQAISGVESIAYEKGYHIIITQTHNSPEIERINISQLAQRAIDGLLISISAFTADYTFLKKLHNDGLPIVFFDSIIDEIDTFKVTSDNFNSVFNAVNSLICAGHENVVFLSGAPQLSSTKERLAGYKNALACHHIPFRPELVRVCYNNGHDNTALENLANELLSTNNKPNAIFLGDEQISICFIRALRKFKVDLKNITITGFSNSEVTDLIQPPISYIRQKTFEMGRVAVEMLLKLIESKHPITEFETRMLNTELISNDDSNIFKANNAYTYSFSSH